MLQRRYPSANFIDGVIDLERLRSGPADSLERNPQRFFELTYLSEDLYMVLRGLSQRFKEGGPGTVLAQAVKGLGKSHTLLLGYHLFASPEEAKAWAVKLGYEWAPPAHAEVIVHKFTDQSMPSDALWMLIALRLGQNWSIDRPPDLDDFRTAIKNRHLVLILDELEKGIHNILDPARRSQNISFLQMLSEEAARDNRVTLFAAVYDGNVEPGSILKRTPRIELHFRKAEDRASIVLRFAPGETVLAPAKRDLPALATVFSQHGGRGAAPRMQSDRHRSQPGRLVHRQNRSGAGGHCGVDAGLPAPGGAPRWVERQCASKGNPSRSLQDRSAAGSRSGCHLYLLGQARDLYRPHVQEGSAAL